MIKTNKGEREIIKSYEKEESAVRFPAENKITTIQNLYKSNHQKTKMYEEKIKDYPKV